VGRPDGVVATAPPGSAGSHASASGRVVALHERPLRLGGALALVLVVFFGIPLVLVVVVSFFDLDKFDIIPTFRPHQLQRAVELPPDLHAVREDPQVRADRVGHHARDRLYGLLFSRLPRAQHPLADGPVLLCTVPFWTSNVIRMDLVDPAFGPPWAPQPVVDRARPRRSPAGVLLFSDFSVVIAYVHLFSCS